MKDKESFFINQFPSLQIGDDGAVIGRQIYTKDLFFEDIHFKRVWMTLEEIAAKSMLVNISDAIVMNAKVCYALIGIEIPSDFTPQQLEALAKGFLKVADTYGFEIIGGDTIAGEKLNISVTLISESSRPVFRRGVQKGDLAAYTGNLGSVKKDLEKLFRGEPVPSSSKFIKPQLRGDFFYEAAPLIHAALDISDGLSKDLSRLAKANRMGFAFNRNISKEELCSGEEYEILFTFDPKNLDTLQEIARKHNTPITVFATAVDGHYESVCPENHFQTQE